MTDKREDGWVSVFGLMLMTVLIVVLIGIYTTGMSLYLSAEVQGIMDTAGVAALRSGVDEVALREEQLLINETVVETAFKRLIRKSKLAELINAQSMSIRTEVIKGDGKLISVGNGLEIESERQQYYLVAVIYAQIPITNILDTDGMEAYYQYFDIFKTSNTTITYSGSDEDGLQEMVIHSVSRLILR